MADESSDLVQEKQDKGQLLTNKESRMSSVGDCASCSHEKNELTEPQEREIDSNCAPYGTKISGGYVRNYTDNVNLLMKHEMWESSLISSVPTPLSRSDECISSILRTSRREDGVSEFPECPRASSSTLVASDSLGDGVNRSETLSGTNGERMRYNFALEVTDDTKMKQFSKDSFTEWSDENNVDCETAVSAVLKSLDNGLATSERQSPNDSRHVFRVTRLVEVARSTRDTGGPKSAGKTKLTEWSSHEFNPQCSSTIGRNDSYDEAMKVDFINVMPCPRSSSADEFRSKTDLSCSPVANGQNYNQKSQSGSSRKGFFGFCSKIIPCKVRGSSKKTRIIHVDELDIEGSKIRLPRASTRDRLDEISSIEPEDGLTEISLKAEDPSANASNTILYEGTKDKIRLRFCPCV